MGSFGLYDIVKTEFLGKPVNVIGLQSKPKQIKTTVSSKYNCKLCHKNIKNCRDNHYVDHYHSTLEIICKPLLEQADLQIGLVCPFTNCKEVIDRESHQETIFKYSVCCHLSIPSKLKD